MLDELVATINTLKARISEHATVLRASEAQTRLSLIDPLLRALGWDTTDPAQVRPEYSLSGGGRADYALLGEDQKPAAILEAKKLDDPLGTMERRMQMLTYANFSNVAYAGLTDGDQWVFYRVFDQKPLPERVVLEVSIASEESARAALKLLLLWRPNLVSGQPIEASKPILGIEVPASAESPAPAPTAAAVPVQNVEAAPQPQPNTAQPTPNSSWHSLRDFSARNGSSSPPKLRLPTGEERDIRNWRGILIETAEWLIRNGALTPNKCPVIGRHRGDNCLINLVPEHKDGRRFPGHHRLSNGLYLNLHHGGEMSGDDGGAWRRPRHSLHLRRLSGRPHNRTHPPSLTEHTTLGSTTTARTCRLRPRP